ncbi:DUF4239 domain-containing protein [Undibacterium jejuense]|uniref:DUF4239 domain-containing protein n=1 Tax=Undibacterium jejuense TaxID=1344949 RepID=A0A923HI00_9BURK|nr:DUF4239 domain-containing protein [Undibacterium jejuense]MBC3862505.1 DUF4239 domain-containing protein [Undibacterium jejuense]
MISWLYTLPDLAIVMIGMICAAVILFSLEYLTRKTQFLCKMSDHEKEFLISLQSGLVALSAVLLSFSLVMVLNNFDSADKNVSVEASKLEEADRTLYQYNNSSTIRADLQRYAQSIVNDEWSQLQIKKSSAVTADLLNKYDVQLGKLNPGNLRESVIFAQILKNANELAELRTNRIERAHLGLHSIFWLVNLSILFGVLLISAFGLALNSVVTKIGVLLQVFGLVGLTAIVFIVDQPFTGKVSVTAEPIVKTIEAMKLR